MKALLDTNVLTELVTPGGNPAVKSAVAEIPATDLYLSVLIVGEIAKGIALLASGRKKKRLATWLLGLENQYGEEILSVDVEIARIWGELTAKAQKTGVVVPPTDGLVAAHDRTTITSSASAAELGNRILEVVAEEELRSKSVPTASRRQRLELRRSSRSTSSGR